MCDSQADFENPVKCSECKGSGMVLNTYNFSDTGQANVEMICPVCDGIGWISQEDAEFYDFAFMAKAPQAFTPAEQTLFEDFPF